MGRREGHTMQIALAILVLSSMSNCSALFFRGESKSVTERSILKVAFDTNYRSKRRANLDSGEYDIPINPLDTISVNHTLDEIIAANKKMFSRIDPTQFNSSFPHAACWYEDSPTSVTDGSASMSRLVRPRMAPNKELRCIPKFFILGVAKSATSDCWSRLTRHSMFARCRQASSRCKHLKEPHFWTIGDRSQYWETTEAGHQPNRKEARNIIAEDQFLTSVDGYVKFYQRFVLDLVLHPRKAIIDASSDVFSESLVGMPGPSKPHIDGPFKDQPLSKYITTPETMKTLVPDAKLLLLLREPAERLFSDYMYFNRTQRESAKSPETFHNECKPLIQSLQMCLNEASKQYGYEPIPEMIGHNNRSITLPSISRARVGSQPEVETRLPSFRAYLSCTDTGGWRNASIAPDSADLQRCPVHLSVYYYGVKYWQEVFQSQIMVLRKEDYHFDKYGVISEIFSHFGIRQPTSRDWTKIHMACQNSESCNVGDYHHQTDDTSWAAKSEEQESSSHSSDSASSESSEILPETMMYLQEFYKPFNMYLGALIGDAMFSWNKQP